MHGNVERGYKTSTRDEVSATAMSGVSQKHSRSSEETPDPGPTARSGFL